VRLLAGSGSTEVPANTAMRCPGANSRRCAKPSSARATEPATTVRIDVEEAEGPRGSEPLANADVAVGRGDAAKLVAEMTTASIAQCLHIDSQGWCPVKW